MKKFLEYCYKNNVVGLRTKTPFNYKDLGMIEPLRVSLYNGISLDDTKHLIKVMKEFVTFLTIFNYIVKKIVRFAGIEPATIRYMQGYIQKLLQSNALPTELKPDTNNQKIFICVFL